MGCVFLCEMTEYNSDLTGVLAVLEFSEQNNVLCLRVEGLCFKEDWKWLSIYERNAQYFQSFEC